MSRKKRPPLYWKTLRIGAPGLVVACGVVMLSGAVWVGAVVLVAGLAIFFLPWLLSPYSAVAHRFAAPTDADLDRSERIADRIGALPVIGVVFRFGERLSGNAGRKAVEEYRRRLHEDGTDI